MQPSVTLTRAEANTLKEIGDYLMHCGNVRAMLNPQYAAHAWPFMREAFSELCQMGLLQSLDIEKPFTALQITDCGIQVYYEIEAYTPEPDPIPAFDVEEITEPVLNALFAAGVEVGSLYRPIWSTFQTSDIGPYLPLVGPGLIEIIDNKESLLRITPAGAWIHRYGTDDPDQEKPAVVVIDEPAEARIYKGKREPGEESTAITWLPGETVEAYDYTCIRSVKGDWHIYDASDPEEYEILMSCSAQQLKSALFFARNESRRAAEHERNSIAYEIRKIIGAAEKI